MPAHEDDTTYTGAGVRKPPKEETAGRDTSDGAACAIEDGVARNFDSQPGIFEEPRVRIRVQLWRYGTSIANWGSRFLSSCDFKELRVIKRARFTTLTLA